MSGKEREDPLWWAEKVSEAGILIGGGAALLLKFLKKPVVPSLPIS